MQLRKTIASFLLILSLFIQCFSYGCSTSSKPLNVIIVFHNHQPFYKDPISNTYILPWVRLHAAKDYCRMPYIVSNFPDVKISFDLSGSLIDQLRDYINGAKDRRQILSEKSSKELTVDEKLEILAIPGGFFDLSWDHILKKIPIYNSLLEKRQKAYKDFGSPFNKSAIAKSFSEQDYLNLQTLFNMFWMDAEYLKSDSTLSTLYNKAMNSIDFTEEDKKTILNEQLNILKKVFEEYKALANKGQIDLFSTPYAHPISPLLIDFGWRDDLKLQIEKSNEVFKKVFGTTPKGIWASECAINDKTLKMLNEEGLAFTISDTENLSQLGIDTKEDPLSKYVPYNLYGVTVFFRDKYLSDGISFRYSGKTVEESLKDVEDTLLSLQKENKKGNLVYTISLDGENAWEYYENDGNDFLKGLYAKLSDLQNQNIIRTITPSEYIEKFGKGESIYEHNITTLSLEDQDIIQVKSYSSLPSKEVAGLFGESSWVNPTLDTWIGEVQENEAWMWLKYAREKLLANSLIDSEEKKTAFENLMKAEGSDWFWWYGSDQDSGNDPSFDRLYKLYLSNIYTSLGLDIPSYLFGNYFPDGTPYKYTDIQLEEGKNISLPFISEEVVCSAVYKNGTVVFNFSKAPKNITIGVYNRKTLNPFFVQQGIPSMFEMSPFPYEQNSIGIPIDFELVLNNFSKVNSSLTLPAENLDKGSIFIAFAAFDNGRLIKLSNPIHVKIPFKLEGTLIGELLDEEGDENGPGNYFYPLNDVFKTAGKGLFDLIGVKVYDGLESYIFDFQFKNLGGNPWNGPNGISFQIVEAYLDVKDGGLSDAIEPKGSRVKIDNSHPWEAAFRVAGWSYGNFIETSDGKTYQGELMIQADQNSNRITVSVPKKYLEIDSGYKPYITVISGSQDGYATGYFRTVNVTASEWNGGGAAKEAFDKNLSPNVYDIFVAEGKSQAEILSGFSVEKETLAEVPMLPLEVLKPSPKVTGSIDLISPAITPPGTRFEAQCTLNNVGKCPQWNNKGNEFILKLPEFVTLNGFAASSGKLEFANGTLLWNGEIPVQGSVLLDLKCTLNDNVPNACNLKFSGEVSFDAKGEGKNSILSKVEGILVVKYPVKIEIPFDSSLFRRNGASISFERNLTAKFVNEFNDISVPLDSFMKAIGGTYEFEMDKKKIIIVFLDYKYEHWIGQNKALLNGSAIPLVPGKPEISSFVENGVPVIPLSAVAYALKFKYNIDVVNKIANLDYLP
jgi:alpha-amylase/alpha-mannosidase (GH57 family)